jgi:hypothetical protein
MSFYIIIFSDIEKNKDMPNIIIICYFIIIIIIIIIIY